METVSAKITYFHKVKRANSNATTTITEVSSNAVLQSQSIDGGAQWQADWATYSGDIRALSASQQTLCKQRETNPGDQYLYNQSMTNLQNNLSAQLKAFYSKY